MIRYTLSVLEMWSFTVYFTVNRTSLIHPIPAQRSLFPLESYSKKTFKKIPRRALVNTKRNVLMPPGHSIILLKSNLFNMGAVSVKWSIAVRLSLSIFFKFVHQGAICCGIYAFFSCLEQ